MAKGYWITFYRRVVDPAALAAYAKVAGPAIQAGGGRFLARGTPVRALEDGLAERSVIIEFDTVAQALSTYDSPAYQAALRLLDGAAERDVRIVEGAG